MINTLLVENEPIEPLELILVEENWLPSLSCENPYKRQLLETVSSMKETYNMPFFTKKYSLDPKYFKIFRCPLSLQLNKNPLTHVNSNTGRRRFFKANIRTECVPVASLVEDTIVRYPSRPGMLCWLAIIGETYPDIIKVVVDHSSSVFFPSDLFFFLFRLFKLAAACNQKVSGSSGFDYLPWLQVSGDLIYFTPDFFVFTQNFQLISFFSRQRICEFGVKNEVFYKFIYRTMSLGGSYSWMFPLCSMLTSLPVGSMANCMDFNSDLIRFERWDSFLYDKWDEIFNLSDMVESFKYPGMKGKIVHMLLCLFFQKLNHYVYKEDVQYIYSILSRYEEMKVRWSGLLKFLKKAIEAIALKQKQYDEYLTEYNTNAFNEDTFSNQPQSDASIFTSGNSKIDDPICTLPDVFYLERSKKNIFCPINNSKVSLQEALYAIMTQNILSDKDIYLIASKIFMVYTLPPVHVSIDRKIILPDRPPGLRITKFLFYLETLNCIKTNNTITDITKLLKTYKDMIELNENTKKKKEKNKEISLITRPSLEAPNKKEHQFTWYLQTKEDFQKMMINNTHLENSSYLMFCPINPIIKK